MILPTFGVGVGPEHQTIAFNPAILIYHSTSHVTHLDSQVTIHDEGAAFHTVQETPGQKGEKGTTGIPRDRHRVCPKAL